MKTVITTWLAGSHVKGTLCLLYIFAVANEHGEVWGSGTYATPEGARRAAKRRGLTPSKGVRALLPRLPAHHIMEAVNG